MSRFDRIIRKHFMGGPAIDISCLILGTILGLIILRALGVIGIDFYTEYVASSEPLLQFIKSHPQYYVAPLIYMVPPCPYIIYFCVERKRAREAYIKHQHLATSSPRTLQLDLRELEREQSKHNNHLCALKQEKKRLRSEYYHRLRDFKQEYRRHSHELKQQNKSEQKYITEQKFASEIELRQKLLKAHDELDCTYTHARYR